MREYIVPIYDDSPNYDEIFVGYIRENAVEVVRCRNCEWWCKDPDGITYCELNSTRCGGNHFCSLGVQKMMEETDD